MTSRIPSSINWLIKKHSKISGEIEKTRKKLKKVQLLVDRLGVLEQELDVIKKSLAMHEIQVDLSLIKPTRPRNLRLAYPRGYILRFVFEYMRIHGKDHPVAKTDIVNALIDDYRRLNVVTPPYRNFTDAVAAALHNHLRAGRITRCHNPVTSDVGLWKLINQHH